jgi:GTP-binding protein
MPNKCLNYEVEILFIDYAQIFVCSGNGGSGIVSFRREKYVPRGGPDGGDGGRGGHIIFGAQSELTTLSDFRYKRHFKAEHGGSGEAGNRTGKNGADLLIPVPVGTVIRNAATKEALADLTVAGTEYLFLRGGRGGRGNARFATANRQAPQIAEKGEPGTELWVELELKLIADVGLIGFPNVGKSTLLSKISAARPKIADYPFTTLIPNLGVVDHKGKSFVAVDIPGLIEGAHQGVGLGLRFLRHVERTRILVHLVDVSGFSGRDPYRDYRQINAELAAYSQSLAAKPQIIALNKTDSPEAAGLIRQFQTQVDGPPAFLVSAATGEGINQLLDELIRVLATIPKEMPQFEAKETVVATDDSNVEIVKYNTAYVVKSVALERRIERYNLDNDDSLRSFQRLLKRWKVEEALLNAGVKEGDLVKIGEYEFTYFPEDYEA